MQESAKLAKPAKRFSRRKFVKWSAAGLAGAVVVERAYDFLSESTAKAKIVIVGAGAAGITMSAYLADMLRYDDITLIDPNPDHHYQPGYTLIAGRVIEPQFIVRTTKSLIPSDARWMQDTVTELNPDNNYVVTAKNGKVSYDFLVLVPGCQMDFNLVPGVSRAELGKNNVHCIYDYQGRLPAARPSANWPMPGKAAWCLPPPTPSSNAGARPRRSAL
jgi:sulfide:quinone oxidoreductase